MYAGRRLQLTADTPQNVAAGVLTGQLPGSAVEGTQLTFGTNFCFVIMRLCACPPGVEAHEMLSIGEPAACMQR